MPSIYQLGYVIHLFKIQIQKGKKALLWNQVKSRMEACYSELILGIVEIGKISNLPFIGKSTDELWGFLFSTHEENPIPTLLRSRLAQSL